jgi:small subunit ribosomal protein S12
MSRINQLIKDKRLKKKKKKKSPSLSGCPQRKGVCLKLKIVSPKKPNSAKRKVAKVFLRSTKKNLIAYIPGQFGHTLQQYSTVLIRGGRVRDIPGMRYKLIRGKGDLNSLADRENARSKYGVKKFKG